MPYESPRGFGRGGFSCHHTKSLDRESGMAEADTSAGSVEGLLSR